MSDNIPQEIWLEILHRQTLKSLVKCTSVCKEWKSLITDHNFISDHFSHTIQANNGNDSLFLQIHRRNNAMYPSFLGFLSFGFFEFYSYRNKQIDRLSTSRIPLKHLFLFKYSRVVGTCNGLVCLTEVDSIPDSANIIIWNPSIRKYLLLPKPRITLNSESYWASFGLGFNSRTNDFKVVRLVALYEKQGTPQVEVYSLATGSWRIITCKAPSILLRWNSLRLRRTAPMFINEKLHWVVSRKSSGQNHKFMLTFDVVEETFGELMLPKCWKLPVTVLSGGDSLAVVHTRPLMSGQSFFKSLSIWVMKEYGVEESWTEMFHLDSRNYGGIVRILSLRRSGEVVLQVLSGDIILLDPMKELVKDLVVTDVFDAWVGYHVESLFLLNKEDDIFSY